VDRDTGLPFDGVPVFKLDDAMRMADERRRQLLDKEMRAEQATLKSLPSSAGTPLYMNH